ncbi:hypothetical protein ZTR_00369 [Talaromyces verruculosus]|nr:hypothetical protein ZTR_00369 [Talaromyces verruculosus]
MAEALAVVGVVASIVQLVDFSTRVVSRLDEFYSVAKEVPKSFRHVKTVLPLLATTLEQLKSAIDTTSVADGSKKALLPVITGCNEQVAQLDAILENTLPEPSDSLRRKGKKAIVSLHLDAKVESITRALRSYIEILTFYYAAASSTLQPLTGEVLLGELYQFHPNCLIDAKLCKIRQWLSAPDPSTNYQKALKLRQADTGLWFLESKEYIEWKTATTSPLWLYGIPGCGKTILSSTVLHNVLQHCQDDPGKVTAYFFFDFNDAQKQDPEMMVRSLLCQLSQQSIRIPASLDALFSSSENGQRQPSAHTLLETLRSIIHEFPQVYIVLDALDECAQRVELMETLEMIAGWKLQNVRLLVTSRKERDIESSLGGLVNGQNRICLQSTIVDKDIQRYVRHRLSTDKDLHKWNKDAVIRREIEDVLRDGAHGMYVCSTDTMFSKLTLNDRFRWAVCQLDALGKCRNRITLRKALATLPPTLDQTYDRILSAISQDDSEYAIRILRWLTFSAQPLSIEAIAEVVAIDVEREPAFDPDEVLEDPSEVLNICSSLVTITTEKYNGWEKPKEVVALAHYSVKEYLLSDRIWTGKADKYGMRADISHNAIAAACLRYLLQLQQSELNPESLKIFKLARYSAEFWTSHATKTNEPTTEIKDWAIRLCCKENPAYVNWIRLWDPDRPWQKPDLQKDLKQISNPLYYTALLGLRDVVKVLLENGADPNAQGGNYGNALQAASYTGHEAVVKVLLDKDADPNTQGGLYGNALQAASYRGHEAVVKTLIARGAKSP